MYKIRHSLSLNMYLLQRSPNFFRYLETAEKCGSLSVSIFLGGKVEEIIGFVLSTTKSKGWKQPIINEKGDCRCVIIEKGDRKKTIQ